MASDGEVDKKKRRGSLSKISLVKHDNKHRQDGRFILGNERKHN